MVLVASWIFYILCRYTSSDMNRGKISWLFIDKVKAHPILAKFVNGRRCKQLDCDSVTLSSLNCNNVVL